jgi:hypothetical protein
MIALHAEWASAPMLEARLKLSAIAKSDQLLDELMPSRIEPTQEAFVLLRVPNFFETLGLLVSAGAVDFDLVKRIYGSDITRQWRLWEPVVSFLAKDQKQESMYREFGALAKRLLADS